MAINKEQILKNTLGIDMPPIPKCNVFEALMGNSAVPDGFPSFVRPDGKALTRGGTIRLSYQLAWALVNRLSLKPGNRLALFSANSTLVPVVFYACFIAGIVVVPLTFSLLPHEVEPLLVDSEASILLVGPSTLDKARQANAPMNLPLWVVDDSDEVWVPRTAEEYHVADIRTLLDPTKELPIHPIDNPEQHTAVIGYSSGTTGKSKGAELTHYNLVSQLIQCTAVLATYCQQGDITVDILPLGHAFGLIKYILCGFYHGITAVVLPKFDLAQYLDQLSRWHVKYVFIPPPVVVLLSKHPLVKEYDLRSLEMLFVGAAPLSASLSDEVETRLGCRVSQGAGMTETTSVVTMAMIDGYVQGSAGKVCPATELRLVNDEGQDVAYTYNPATGRSFPGEIWVRAPTVFKGYLNNAQATKETFAEGNWLKTGDIGEHKDGSIWYVDRKKELIKYKGYQVAPSELEALLLQHPDVSDAAVVGIYDDSEATELPRAFIAVHADSATKKDLALKVQSWAAERVSSHKRLRGGVYVVDSIPKSSAGKILRRLLRDVSVQPQAKL